MSTVDNFGPDDVPPELRYQEVSEEGYASAAAAFHREVSARATIVLSGSCPRCDHVMEYLISETALKSPIGRPPAGPASYVESAASEPEYMCCTCEQAHPGRPASYFGCGAYWPLPPN